MSWTKLASRQLGIIPVQSVEITSTDVAQIGNTNLWLTDSDTASLFTQISQDTNSAIPKLDKWRTFYGTSPDTKATGSVTLLNLDNSIGISFGDWISVGGYFFQFVASKIDAWPTCQPVIVASGATPATLATALVAAIAAASNVTVTASVDSSVVGKVNFTSTVAGNEEILASIATNADIFKIGMLGAPIEINSSTHILHKLNYTNNGLSGFSVTALNVLSQVSTTVLAIMPESYCDALGIDYKTLGKVFLTVDHGVTWIHLPNIKINGLLELIPEVPFVRGPAGELAHPPFEYDEMTGYSRDGQLAPPPIWTGPMGDTPGSAGANMIGQGVHCDQ